MESGGGGGGLGEAEQVVMGVELTHVADGFTWRDVTWRNETRKQFRPSLLRLKPLIT